MKVLVACEFSGTVRDAFIRHGHDAISCDLRPTDAPGPHIQGDVLDIIYNKWDLVIAHPPCTYLCNSGVRWLNNNVDRHHAMMQAIEFFKWFLMLPRVCVENPIMHGYAKRYLGHPTQYIQPYEFGHHESKKTGLWLRGLPLLQPTKNVKREMEGMDIKESNSTHWAPRKDRAKFRSITYYNVAEAMAKQWGGSK